VFVANMRLKIGITGTFGASDQRNVMRSRLNSRYESR
jgi:hypothetical protein